jgi:Domain of Unknown Function (DUF1080)
MIRNISTAMILLVATSLLASPLLRAEDDFTSLFNGTDLTGWDGDPALWKVVDGIVVGTCSGPESPKHNDFLIWRGGTVKDFTLVVVARVIGDNNSGIQYRSKPLPEVGPWAITGYQSDIHPALQHTGMTYEEKGRGIFGLNGQNILVDPEGQRWLVSEHEPVAVDVAQWNEYTIIARGNQLEHRINGKVSSSMIDFDERSRALEGLLAVQLHSGNANTIEIKEMRLQVLDDVEVIPFTEKSIPSGATKIEKTKTANPQGLGTPSPAVKSN